MGQDPHRPGDEGEADRAAILARRRKLIAAALSGLALSGCASSSGGADAAPDARIDASMDDGTPQPCLTADAMDVPRDDGEPMPCLTAEPDAMDVPGDDAEPMPCLSPPPDAMDVPGDDAEPMPCLRVAPDAGED